MDFNQILLQGVSLNQLMQSFSDVLDSRLNELKNQEKEDVKYLTRKQVASILSISLPTLHDWVKKKILKSYRVGNRVYFKSNELENSLKRINK